jgi:activator of HSP90 ATPase
MTTHDKNLQAPALSTVSTRRQIIATGIVVAGSLAWGSLALAAADPQQTMAEKPDSADKSIWIHQEVDFKAPPARLYEALLDSKQFSTFSGMPAEINREAGGKFSLFNGHIIGRNLELVPNQRVVQGWRVVTWEEGIYSIVRFELKAQGAGTHLVFDHTGFPEGKKEHLAEGWKQNYWEKLQKYFG